MRYTYRCNSKDCPNKGVEVDRRVPVDDRDKQVCDCGAKLERLFIFDASQVCVSTALSANLTFSDIGPSSEVARKRWEEMGVRRMDYREV